MWPFQRKDSQRTDFRRRDLGVSERSEQQPDAVPSSSAAAQPDWSVADWTTPTPPPTDVSIVDLPGSTLTEKLGHLSQGERVFFPAGEYCDPDFDRPSNYPVYCIFEQRAGALVGAGVDQTILSVRPNSASQGYKRVAELVDYTDVNPYFLARVDGSPLICDLTFLGTDQADPFNHDRPLDYNNLVLFQTKNAVLRDVKVLGHRGSKAYPPGETMGINDYRGSDLLMERVEIDGRTPGTEVSQTASGFGANFAEDETFNDCYFHDFAHGSCMTSYQGSGSWTANGVWAVRSNWAGFNFERGNNMIITLNNCRSIDNAIDLVIDSDLGSNHVTINDPVLEPGQRFRVCVHERYGYPPGPNTPPNRQCTGDIRLTVNGKDRPDLLEIVSNYRPLSR